MKSNKGITLIALVITIIVLLILAGVSIAMLSGENSILNRASQSSIKNQLGSANDVATSSSYAKNMVVLKVDGNLTINSGVTLTTVASSEGYGGPKGFLIYCTGTLTNNGTINMTARGAWAEGQNVYIWQNTDKSYEYVPKNGAIGGTPVYGTSNGNAGAAGTNRQTGRRWFRRMYNYL